MELVALARIPEHTANQRVFKEVSIRTRWTRIVIRPDPQKPYLMWGIGKCTADESEVCAIGDVYQNLLVPIVMKFQGQTRGIEDTYMQ